MGLGKTVVNNPNNPGDPSNPDNPSNPNNPSNHNNPLPGSSDRSDSSRLIY